MKSWRWTITTKRSPNSAWTRAQLLSDSASTSKSNEAHHGSLGLLLCQRSADIPVRSNFRTPARVDSWPGSAKFIVADKNVRAPRQPSRDHATWRLGILYRPSLSHRLLTK